jgi:putative transposase
MPYHPNLVLMQSNAIPSQVEPANTKGTKAERIKASIRRTKKRRESQVCKTYQLKIDISHASKTTREILRRLFLEAKWFYNDMLARGQVFEADYKVREVQVKNADGGFETRELRFLSSQMRQEVVDRAKDNIRGLRVLKINGNRVGSLKFKNRVQSIPLKQYGKTHEVKKGKFRIQNIPQLLRVRGLDQISENAEMASAVLLSIGRGYYVHLTTFQREIKKERGNGSLGIDFGIENQLTFSNGVKVKEGVYPARKIARIHRKLSRRIRHGRNWFKALAALHRSYDGINCQKRDIRNKIVARMVSDYETIKVQDEEIRSWMTMWGKKSQASAVGGIMSALKLKAHTLIEVPRFTPTTKTC